MEQDSVNSSSSDINQFNHSDNSTEADSLLQEESFSSNDSTRTIININSNNTHRSNSIIRKSSTMAETDKAKLSDIEALLKVSPPPRLNSNLNHDNLEDWSINLKYILTYHKLDAIIKNDFKTDVSGNEDFIRLDEIVKSIMLSPMNSSIRRKLDTSKTSKDLLSQIENVLKGDTQVQSIKLFSKIVEIIIKKPQNLSYLVQTVRETMDKFDELYKDDTKKEIWKCIFIAGLADEHDNLRSNLMSNENLTIDQYFSQALKRHNVHKSSRDTSKVDKTSINSIKENNSPCFECKGKHKLRFCPIFKEKKKQDPNYKPKALIDFQKRKESNGTGSSESASSSSKAYFAPLICNLNLSKSSKTYLDSGATAYVVNSRDLLSNFKFSSNESVSTASGEEFTIQGMGERLLNFGSHTLNLSNVILCESIQANFISVRALADKGFKTTFIDDQAIVTFKEETVFHASIEKETDLYKVIHVSPSINAINYSAVDLIYKWHIRLGHISIQKLKVISDKIKIKIPNDFKIDCTVCNMKKLSKLPFNSSLSKSAIRPGQEFHMDLSGKIRIFNKQHFSYFLLFTDVFSRYTHLFLLKRKNEVAEVFEYFTKLIRNKFNNIPIEKVHSDNGSEFINQQIKSICESEGITQSFTTINCPQENGIVERNNRSVEQLARSLLKQANLKTEFWPYAVMHAVILKNRLPHSSLKDNIPFDLFHNIEFTDYNRFSVFGAKCFYVLEKSERQSKFSETSKEAIYLGKSSDSSGSYVFDPVKNCVLVRRHIKITNNFLTANTELEDHDLSQPLSDLVDRDYDSDSDKDDYDNYYRQRVHTQINKESNDKVSSDDIQSNCSNSTNQEIIFSSNNEQNSSNNNVIQSEHSNLLSQDNLIQQNLPQKGNTYEFNQQQLQQFKDQYKDNIGKDFDIRFFAPVHKVINGSKTKGVSKYKICIINVPKFFHQVNKSNEKSKWYDAMKEEINCMKNKNVFELVKRPRNVPVIPAMWVYRVKFKIDGSVDKYKARLVALGNKQSPDNEFNYSPVINQLSLRTVLAYACKNKMHVHQLDVCSAYLNSDLDEPIYLEQPLGFQDDKKNHVWLLKKAIYGLRSSALKWYETITEILTEMKFKRTSADECVFVRNLNNVLVIIAVYVDDIIICTNSIDTLNEVKLNLDSKIQISDKGIINQFLNLNIIYDKDKSELTIDARSYIDQTLTDMEMSDCQSKYTPMVVGSDIYNKDSELLEDKSYYMSGLGRLIYLSHTSRYSTSGW